MRALVVTPDAELVVADPPRSRAGAGRGARAGARRRASTAPTSPSGRATTPAPPGSPPDIPGLEFAGEVVAARAAGSTAPAVGARVFGIAGGGGQAELLAVPATQCAPRARRRSTWSPRAACPRCSSPLTTPWSRRPRLQPGETLLVHAVGSGVGTAALQLGKAMGCTVVGTARTAEKLERCRGARARPRGARAAREFDPERPRRRHHRGGGTGRRDPRAGGWRLRRGRSRGRRPARPHRADRPDGGRTRRRRPRRDDVQAAPGRSARRSAAARSPRRPTATDAFARDVVPLLESGAVTPVIARTLPLDDAREAYDLLAADAVFGSLVLDLHLNRRRASPDQHGHPPAGPSARSTRNGRTESSPITQTTESWVSGSSRTICR